MRRALAILVLVTSALGIVLVSGSPASADDASTEAACYFRDDISLNSGVTSAYAYLLDCGSYYEVGGTVCDTSNDNRQAYLDLRKNSEGGSPSQRVEAYGYNTCGDAGFSFPHDLSRVWVRTRACNGGGCSSQASGYLYP